MMRSLYSGVSGLKNHQTRMDIIGNNIANVNTAGFKASRVVFQDVYSQMTKAASAPNGTTVGGTNSRQIGLGVNLCAIDIIHSSAATQRTDGELDLAIEGDGFFVVKAADGQTFYTRSGNLYVDEAGNLVTAGGNYLLGLMGTSAQLSATDLPNPPADPLDPDPNGVLPDGFTVGSTNTQGTLMLHSDNYYYYQKESATPGVYEVDTTRPYMHWTAPPEADSNFGGVAGSIDPTKMVSMNLAGFTGIAIDENGIITGLDSVGEKRTIGIIALATFTNTSGLEKKGNSLYSQTGNSGVPVYNQAQTGGAGKVNPGGLEMSNVDLSNEFTDMIVTQRGFQANSRIITVSDTLLEELINLKR